MRKYLAVFRVTLRERTVYVADLVGRSLFMLLFLFVFVNLWSAALPGGARFAGMDRTAVVWYLVVTEGLMLTAPRLGEAISEDVKSGAFAVHLLRPCSYVLFRFAVYLGEMVVSLALNLAAGSAVALCLVGPPPLRLPDLPLALIALGLGIVLNFCITCALGLVAFWVEDTDPFFWIHNKCLLILGGVMIPLEFFPDSLRWVADHAPFGSIFWAPARLVVLHDDGAPALVLGQCGWIAFFAVVLWLVYRAGHRRVSVHGG